MIAVPVGKKARKKPGRCPGIFYDDLCAVDLVALQAARTDITRFDLAVLDIGHLLHVCLESALGLTVGVADVVSGCLAFSANAANSRHNKPPEGRKFRRYPIRAFLRERIHNSIYFRKKQ